MNEPIIIGLKIVIALCVTISAYCIWELWQDWKLDRRLRAGLRELRRQGKI